MKNATCQKAERVRRTWSFNQGKIVLNLEDVCYFESYQRKTAVCTDSERFRISTTLRKEEEDLAEERFVRTHQGFLVRIDQIKIMRGCELILKNGVHIPVSRRNKDKVHQKLRDNG
ncbi:MAG: LytTR family DNA-binding domain-containing protein [Hungatella sp.]